MEENTTKNRPIRTLLIGILIISALFASHSIFCQVTVKEPEIAKMEELKRKEKERIKLSKIKTCTVFESEIGDSGNILKRDTLSVMKYDRNGNLLETLDYFYTCYKFIKRKSYKYGKNGNLLQMREGYGKYPQIFVWKYNRSGNLRKSIFCNYSMSYKTKAVYYYNKKGNLITIKRFYWHLPSGKKLPGTIQYFYNMTESRIDSICSVIDNGQEIWYSKSDYVYSPEWYSINEYGYTEANQVTIDETRKFDYSGNEIEVNRYDEKNGVVESRDTFEYDSYKRLTGEYCFDNTGFILSYKENSYDDAGRLVKYVRANPGLSFTGETIVFTDEIEYDANGSIIRKIRHRTGAPDKIEQYEYEYR